jgi:DNA-binding response OmpR family regulator
MSNTKILIVDDESDLLEMYVDFLSSEGLKVSAASSGEDALEKLKSEGPFDLIISDSNMGKISGFDLFNKIKAESDVLPLFYLSTGDVSIDEKDLINKGMTRLLIKPFDLDEIVAKIKLDLKI